MAEPLRSFPDVLSAAIDDIVAHGFDSMERIDRWTRALREAAERQAGDPATTAQTLKDALAAIYRREVDQLALLKKHQGDVPRYTIDKVKPHLRAELDRRIQASADLIKRDREKAIAQTLDRFRGWSTSIPKGGVSAEKKSEVKANQRKAMAGLPFEERRVLIDQGYKLVGALSEIVAADGGAIAGIWRSHYRQAGYDYREDHAERDGKFFLIRDSWAHRAGLVRKGGQPYYDEIDAVGQKPFCRCYMIWVYNLRDLPPDMLTREGRRKLVEVGQHTNATRAFARTDSADPGEWFHDAAVDTSEAPISPWSAAVAEQVVRADRLGYRHLVRGFQFVEDRDQWHGSEDGRVVTLEEKFRSLPEVEQSHILLHEIGHAGQDADAAAWSAFQRAHGGSLAAFEAMANPAHLEDFARRGRVDGGVGSEVFAESYARFCLGLPLPARLLDFWTARARGLRSQLEARYFPWWPSRPSRCARCSMFVPGLDPRTNTCTAVAGEIAMQGHCELFEIRGARTDSASGEDDPPKVGYAAHQMRLDRLQREADRIAASSAAE